MGLFLISWQYGWKIGSSKVWFRSMVEWPNGIKYRIWSSGSFTRKFQRGSSSAVLFSLDVSIWPSKKSCTHLITTHAFNVGVFTNNTHKFKPLYHAYCTAFLLFGRLRDNGWRWNLLCLTMLTNTFSVTLSLPTGRAVVDALLIFTYDNVKVISVSSQKVTSISS